MGKSKGKGKGKRSPSSSPESKPKAKANARLRHRQTRRQKLKERASLKAKAKENVNTASTTVCEFLLRFSELDLLLMRTVPSSRISLAQPIWSVQRSRFKLALFSYGACNAFGQSDVP